MEDVVQSFCRMMMALVDGLFLITKRNVVVGSPRLDYDLWMNEMEREVMKKRREFGLWSPPTISLILLLIF